MTKRSKASVMKKLAAGKAAAPSRKLLGQSQQDLHLKCRLLAEQFQVIVKTTDTLFGNQKELAKQESKLDEQFCVLTRLAIMSLNEIKMALNIQRAVRQEALQKTTGMANAELADKPLTLIGYDDVNKMFHEWSEFHSRPDWRNFTREWFMGDDLSKLPPPPEVKKEGEQDAVQTTSDQGNPESSDVASVSPVVQADEAAAVPEV
jgi:hypothetical protein